MVTKNVNGILFYGCDGLSLDLLCSIASVCGTFNRCRKYWPQDMSDGFVQAIAHMGWWLTFDHPSEFNEGDIVAVEWRGDPE